MDFGDKKVIACLSAFVSVLCVAVLVLVQSSSPTGFVVEPVSKEAETYAQTLNHVVLDFFDVAGVVFPQGACVDVAKGLYNSITMKSLDTSEGFMGGSRERLMTLNFALDWSEKFGTIDMVRGKSLIGENEVDSFISINTETGVHVPRKDRITFFSMDLYGDSTGVFMIHRGRFSTPSVDCEFTSNKGIADCSCRSHAIKGWWSD